MNTKVGQPPFYQAIYPFQEFLQSYLFICIKKSKYYYPHLTTEETKTQQYYDYCLQSSTKLMTKPVPDLTFINTYLH